MDKYLKKVIENFYQLERNKIIDIRNIIKTSPKSNFLYIDYHEKYFDGGGYMWSGIRKMNVDLKTINPYLRKYKLNKIKNRV